MVAPEPRPIVHDPPFSFDFDALLAACTRLLGAPAQFRLMSHARWPATQLDPPVRGPVVAILLENDVGGLLLVEATPVDAAQVVDLALGGAGALEAARDQYALSGLSEGVVMYVAARLLADAGTSLTVRSVLQERASVVAALSGRDVSASEVQVTLGSHTLRLRLLCPLAARSDELCIELDTDTTVNPGDVVVPERTWLANRPVIGRYATLRADGRILADGKVTDIDGEIGVRVDRVMR